jgi:hypothetical protein
MGYPPGYSLHILPAWYLLEGGYEFGGCLPIVRRQTETCIKASIELLKSLKTTKTGKDRPGCFSGSDPFFDQPLQGTERIRAFS